jgi:SAM-dependent methyltransferase
LINSSTSANKCVRPFKIWRDLHHSPSLARHAALYTWAAQLISEGWVLDLGCEYGIGSLLIPETNPHLQVLGIDTDLSALSYGEGVPSKEKIAWVNANGNKLPIASGTFSGIYLINLLHLVEDTTTLLLETQRTLKSNGVAILSIPRNHSMEAGPGKSPLIKQLEMELNGLFSEVIYPDEICGQIPSFSPQTYRIDQHPSIWVAVCRKK